MNEYIRTVEAINAVRARISANHTCNQIANELDINSAHITRLLNGDYLSPKLDKALVREGLLLAKPKRLRRCGEWYSQAEIDAVDFFVDWNGVSIAQLVEIGMKYYRYTHI